MNRKPMKRQSLRSALGIKKTIRKEVKKIVNYNVETKYHGVSHTKASMSTTALVQDLCIVPQGVNDYSRIGDEILLSSVRLRFFFERANTTPSDAYNNIRVLLFQWNVDNSVDAITGPNLDKILHNYIDSASTSTQIVTGKQ